MIEDAKEKLQEKAKNYINQFKSDERNLKEVLGREEYPIQNVNFFERSARIFVGEEKISELRTRLDEEERRPNLIGTKNFEVERSDLLMEFDEDVGEVIISAPVWERTGGVFVVVDEFRKRYNCRITDDEDYLSSKIENLEEKLNKHRQLQKDIS